MWQPKLSDRSIVNALKPEQAQEDASTRGLMCDVLSLQPDGIHLTQVQFPGWQS
ncbi:hypothetical protein VSR68_29900 [Paraburkholderia phymatum]|uniref:hypothetical protein n=1 Tax=Paraburkholderia phymatum TaxID=148447 RepID=UPI003177A96F